ncbi:type II secretion system secretin GspD [Desulfobacterota bacterium M19]
MKIFNRLLLIIMAVMLPLNGCSYRSSDLDQHKTWMDLHEISQKVDKATAGREKQPPLLSAKKKAVPNKPAPGPDVRDLSSKEDTINPYLKSMTGQKPQEKTAGVAGEGVMLNFDNADIYEVIQVIAETLNISYIIDPAVKGTVNIRSGKKIPTNQLFVIFKKILNINGLDIRNEGDHYYIYVAGKPSSTAIYNKNQVGELKPSARLITQIVPIMHLASADAQKLIEPYLSKHSVVYNLPDQNTLIISDFESQIIDALRILSRLDVSSLSSLVVEMVRVKQAPLFDLRDELVEVLKALKVNKKSFEGVQIIPLERVNSLLIIGYDKSLVATAIKWVKELDRAPTAGRDSIYIYNVRNSVASDLANLVSSLISGKGVKSSSRSSKNKRLTPPGSISSGKSMRGPIIFKKSRSGLNAASMQFAGAPVLIPDDSRNIIMIRGLYPDYVRIRKLLERLDNMPMQVLIEVMVAQVSLDDNLKYGVEWALKNNAAEIHGTGISFNEADGLKFNLAFDDQTDIFKLFNFLATNNNFTVLSSPQVLVLNNETATVNVGEQVPIITSETSDTTSSTTSNRTVQYKDTGVILKVTPRINNDGIILLDIDQQVSSVKDQTTSGVDSPTISTKEIKTKLAVKNGQSILMGGLIAHNKTTNVSGVPLLKDIPGLGWLFKTKSIKNSKTELMVMVTPYVISSEDVLDEYIKNFKEKLTGLRQQLEK